MRFISLAALVLFMVWTFQITFQRKATPYATHTQLTHELKDIMVDYLQNNVPGVKNITFYKLYTEVKKPGAALTAFVKYSYESPTEGGAMTKEIREGEFDLVSVDSGRTWEPTARNFKGLNIEFMDDVKITPSSTYNH